MGCEQQTIVCELGRIANAQSGFDWNGFLATFLATLAGAFVAAAVTLWVTGRERPRPHWRVEANAIDPWVRFGGRVIIAAKATNIGDGTAYNVVLTVQNAEQNGPPVSKARLESGEDLSAGLYVRADGNLEYDAKTDEYNDTRCIDWPQRATLLIEWQEPPRRNTVRRKRVLLVSPLPVAQIGPITPSPPSN